MKHPMGAIPLEEQSAFLKKCADNPGTVFWIVINTHGRPVDFCPIKAWTMNKTKYDGEINILKDFRYHYYDSPSQAFYEGWLEGLPDRYLFFENFWFAFAYARQLEREPSSG